MNRNVKIAKQLVRIAKSLVASEKEMDFYDLMQFLEENGWCFHNDYQVKSPEGRTGTRFELSEYPQNIEHVEPVSKKEMQKKLEELEKEYGNVVQSIGTHRYAPELNHLSIILLD